MEPSFLATPYMQANMSQSREIRAMLDERESSYLEWRSKRKPIRHDIASKKLNKLPESPISDKSGHPLSSLSSPQDIVRHKFSLGPQTSSIPALSVIKRKCAIQIGCVVRPQSPQLDLPRLSRAKTSGMAVELQPHGMRASVGVRSTPELPQSRGRGTKLALKCLKPYLHDYHTRQVFAFAGSEDEDEDEVYDVDQSNNSEDEEEPLDHPLEVSPLALNPVVAVAPPTERRTSTSRNIESLWIIDGLSVVSTRIYDAIFAADWQSGTADKSVRDAVDRKRISVILRGSYRVLLWFFRFYAGNAAVAAAATLTGEERLTAVGSKLFEVPSSFKLLEDLNIQCVDPAHFGLVDMPLKRDELVPFLLAVARMLCFHDDNPTRHRVLVGEGVELSETVRMLVRDHFVAFSQIQDINHFRSLFLQKKNQHSRVGSMLAAHAIDISCFFEELTRPQTSDGGWNRQRLNGVTCSQFLSVLHALKLIIVKGTSIAATASGDAPAGIDEVRAVRIFLSCLPMEPPCGTTGGVATPQDLKLPHFIEALLRLALAWRERAICRGGYDVCPGQLTSDPCRCSPESVDFAFDVFDDAVAEILDRVQAYRFTRSQKPIRSRRMSLLGQQQHHPGLRAQARMVSILNVNGAPE